MKAIKLKTIEQEFIPVLLGKATQVQEWQSLVDYSIKKRLFPQFFFQLQRQKSVIPQNIFSSCESLYLTNLRANLIQEKELVSILFHFKEKKIPVIVLKGLLFARIIYDDLANRQVATDFDLLVHPEHFPLAKEILMTAGYVCQAQNQDEAQSVSNLKYYGQVGFWRKSDEGNTFCIDLHQELRGVFAYPQLLDLWQDVEELDFPGIKVIVPSTENLFIYLCLLAMSLQAFPELRYFYDIHSFIGKYRHQLNWEKLAQKLVGFRHDACVYFALELSRDLFGTDVPKDYRKELRPGLFKRRFVSIWLNKENIMFLENKKRQYYFTKTWHIFATSCLYSKGFFDCLNIILRKIFLPMELIAGTEQSWGRRIFLYGKWFLNKMFPFRFLNVAVKASTKNKE